MWAWQGSIIDGLGQKAQSKAATGKITRYPMPDAAAKDPHTITFTPKGDLWFTLQNSTLCVPTSICCVTRQSNATVAFSSTGAPVIDVVQVS